MGASHDPLMITSNPTWVPGTPDSGEDRPPPTAEILRWQK